MDNNFTAVKVGDVNASATVNAHDNTTDTRSSKTLTLATVEQSFDAGENVQIAVTADNFDNISGAQWTFNFDNKALAFENVVAGALSLTNDNIHYRMVKSHSVGITKMD